MITKALIDKFYEDVELLGLKFPVAAISKATNFGKGQVSDYLKKNKEPSENFITAFYQSFGKSLKNVPRASNGDLQTFLRDLTEGSIKHEAALNIIIMTLAELIAGKSGKSTAYEHSELLKTISSESDRIQVERRKKG